MERDPHIERIVRRFIPLHVTGGAWGVYHRGAIQVGAAGLTMQTGGEVVTPDTWFDLASLTKVVGTLPAILLGAKRNLFTLGDVLGRWMPDASSSLGRTSIRSVLSHTAGLPPDFGEVGQLSTLSADGLWDCVRKIATQPRPDQAVYSDVGYFLLGRVIESVWERAYLSVIQDVVLQGLSIEVRETVNPSVSSVAATRYCPVRERVLHGEAQNMAVWKWGRAAGHAGLFATVRSVLQYGVWWLSMLKDPCYSSAREPIVPGRGLGWMLAGCPQLPDVDWPPDAFGHTGFTGTSIVVIPSREMVGVLLTNRTHSGMNNPWIRPLREEFYSALIAQCE